jgi:multiple sugar transport system substrate-binding protein
LFRGAAALGATAALPALSGCGGDNPNELTFFFQAAPQEAVVRMRIIDAFAKLHPEIAIRTELAGPSPQQQILTYCAGGRCPDILMSWESYSWAADLGVLLDLNTMMAHDRAFAAALRADASPLLYNLFDFRGGQYALPEQWAGVFLYYNKALFDRAGLPEPPARWADAWTFDEFLAAAQALTERDRDGNVTQWGFVDAWAVPYYSAAIFGMNNGVEWFSPPNNPTHTNMDNDQFIAGFQFYADLPNKYRVAPSLSDVQAITGPGPDLFGQGKAGMALLGHWYYSTFSGQPGLDFDVTVLPKGPDAAGGAKSDVGVTGLSIAAGSRHKEQAWEFLKFACGPAGQAISARSGLFVPALRSAQRSAEFARAHPNIEHLEVFTGGPDNANPLPVTPRWQRVGAALARGCDHVLRGAAPATWFKQGLTAEIDKLLNGAV